MCPLAGATYLAFGFREAVTRKISVAMSAAVACPTSPDDALSVP